VCSQGDISTRDQGSLVAHETGQVTSFACESAQARGVVRTPPELFSELSPPVLPTPAQQEVRPLLHLLFCERYVRGKCKICLELSKLNRRNYGTTQIYHLEWKAVQTSINQRKMDYKKNKMSKDRWDKGRREKKRQE
jgi:hypothetical protein